MNLSSVKLNYIFDFLLPRFCISCNSKLLIDEVILCPNCFSEFKTVDEQLLKSEFLRKFASEKIISDFLTAYIFKDESPIEKTIHSLKYKQNFHLGKFLGKQTGLQLKEKINSWNADLIIPIPLHPLRKSERGFNQAAEISKGISEIIQVPFNHKIIRRNRFTKQI